MLATEHPLIDNVLVEPGKRLQWMIESGMSVEAKEHIGAFMQFDRIVQGQQGVGLGLAIVLRLAELHDGHIKFESKPGKGTVVQFALPQKDTDDIS